MAEMEPPQVRTGLPDRGAVLELLNDAYDGWGTPELFAWKYEQYPGFDPNRHCYWIERDGEVGAFRRIFERPVVSAGRECSLFVLGDTAVSPDHQGEGLYSALHQVTTEAVADQGVVGTFNRVGNLTFDANRKRGWTYRTLPLRLHVRDYSRVVSTYATNVVSQDSAADRVMRGADRLFDVRTSNGQSVALAPGATDGEGVVPLWVPERVIDGAIGVASASRPLDSVRTRFVGGGSSTRTRTEVEAEIEIQSDGASVAASELRQTVDDQTPTFQRDTAAIEHLLAYPDAVTVLVRTGDDLVGWAIVGGKPDGSITEGRVLAAHWTRDGCLDALTEGIACVGDRRDFDLLVGCLPGDVSDWIPVERQVLMWDPETSTERESTMLRNARIGLADTL